MHGKFPQILKDEKIGKEATALYNDAQKLLKKIIDEKWLFANGVIGFWEAVATAPDTITLYENGNEIKKLEFLRQQIKKAEGQPNLSLADFIKPCPSPQTTIQSLSPQTTKSPQTTMQVEDSTKAPSRREGVVSSTVGKDGAFGYEWADPSSYKLLKEFALTHRNKPTNAEDKLWKLVKTKKFEGYKFRRQHIIGNYIADLVCLDKRLIIEIDGLIHQLPDNKEADEESTLWLNKTGF